MLQKLKYSSLIFFQIIPFYLQASPLCTPWVAKAISIQGKVDVQRSGNLKWQSIKQSDTFCWGDKIRTAKKSRATIQLSNESLINLDQSTRLNFALPKVKTSTWFIDLLKGSAFFRSRKSHHLNIKTPFINAVHEGTEFMVSVDDEKTEVSVFDGQVAGINRQGEIQIKKGFIGVAKKNQSPYVRPLTIQPEDAVQWTFYYPPIVDYQQFESAKSIIYQPIVNAYQQGDTHLALELVDKLSPSELDTDYLLLKSSLLLSVGRVDKALTIIDSIKQDNCTALALRSVIAMVKNQKNEALILAKKGVMLMPESTIAHIALSYAHQSLFEIESALKATQEALILSPGNALVWARLSELQLSSGDHRSALKSAQKAQQINPQLARAQIILGFSYLTLVDIDEAINSFTRAIALDSTDPLARLGLGLAKIRKGKVKQGTRDLETAVSLDPENAIMRSYLGKAYYELKNKDYASTELTIAKEIDPNDPTPWFYDALHKQTTNRPIEALHDMQKAIELNNNRGVYRSSLLLDEDLAARSASLGRIYNDLGFQQLGLVQSWKSLNIDPGNYSSHRLLADNYAALPRHEVARVSELLKSQLLQPINLTPVQPLLGQSDLLIIDGLGPSEAAFNEFNPLFVRNRLALQASGIFAGNNTWGDEVVQSGIWNNLSYSAGQHHYETDGFRSNSDLERDLYTLFVQGQITTNLNLQAEFKYEDRENGDLSFNFDPANFSESFKENTKVKSYRAGGRYSFSTNNKLLASVIYQDIKINQNKTLAFPFTIPISHNISKKGFIAEIQNIYKHHLFTATSGITYINQNVEISKNGMNTGPDVANANFYSYWSLHPAKELSVSLGLGLNTFNRKHIIRHQSINPKVGLIWKPSDFTTIRLAGFRQTSMSRTANQTIEPTQVAGFNQFFTDLDGSDTWRYGLAVDHTYSPNLYFGLEYSERIINSLVGKSFFDWKEQLGRAYLYWTPHPSLAFSSDYLYENIDRGDHPHDTGILDVEIHKVPLSLSFFHQTGISAKLKGTYVYQDGRFINNPNRPNSEFKGQTSFFLADATISYRLPQRYGRITLGINNIFAKKFNYQNINVESPLFVPERVLFSRFTLAF